MHAPWHSLVNHFAPLLADGAAPFDVDSAFRVFSRALHIMGAIILGGGLFYIRSVLSYSGPDACFAGRRVVWARWVAFATFLLLFSGAFNFYVIYRQSKAPGGTPLPPT